MTPAKPSLELLRSLTDEHVLRALMEQRRLTRAELAARTGISKPTVSESVRRLAEAGLLADTGERTTGRGRVGSYYALADGRRLRPGGQHRPGGDRGRAARRPRRRDRHGDRRASRARPRAGAGRRGADGGGPDSADGRRATAPAGGGQRRRPGGPGHRPPGPPARRAVPARRTRPGRRAGRRSSTARSWSTTTSTGRHEPNATPPAARSSTTSPTCTSARAWAAPSSATARSAADTPASPARSPSPRRPVPTAGPCPSSRCSARSASAIPASTAIDVPALLAAVESDDARARDLRATLARAICGVLAAVVAFCDPAIVVIGGTWGAAPVVLDTIAAEFERLPRHVPIRAARLTDAPSLAGARNHALHELQATIATSTRSP